MDQPGQAWLLAIVPSLDYKQRLQQSPLQNRLGGR
jgi:hypothetical protein